LIYLDKVTINNLQIFCDGLKKKRKILAGSAEGNYPLEDRDS